MVTSKKKTIPQEVGFYLSMEDYRTNAYRSTESVVVYVRTHIGQWYANGTIVPESKLPGDLLLMRPVQP